MNMSVIAKNISVNTDEYLQGELKSNEKHELIDGDVYAMAGASGNHERISLNISRKFGNHLEGLPCEPFGSDMKVKVGSDFFYPDVIVDCSFDESEPYYTESPVIIVEVLSKSTRRIDETIKRKAYLTIPSLQEYVLIEQDIVDIEVVRRTEGWQSKHYFLGDEVTFESIDLTLSVEEIYLRVQNEDVKEFLAQKE
jgi:Uma2 family endonuclease